MKTPPKTGDVMELDELENILASLWLANCDTEVLGKLQDAKSKLTKYTEQENKKSYNKGINKALRVLNDAGVWNDETRDELVAELNGESNG